jgi:hypothetical protein
MKFAANPSGLLLELLLLQPPASKPAARKAPKQAPLVPLIIAASLV